MMQKLHSLLNYAADTSGDLSLAEYACLVTISESESGLSTRHIERAFSGCKNPAALVASLEDKELVERTRNRLDRRTFSFLVTAKGHSRIDLMDEALSLALIDASDKLTEAAFGQLQEQLHSLVSLIEGQHKITTLLPGKALAFLCNYHDTVVKIGSLFGISSAQAAALILIGEAEAGTSAERVAHLLLVPIDTLLLHLEKLGVRGLVRRADSEGGFVLLDEGRRRVDSFITRFESSGGSFSAASGQLEKDRPTAVEDLLELLLYLFFPQGNTPASKSQRCSYVSSSPSNRVTALSLLFALLAQLFSYPDRTSSPERFSIALIDKSRTLLEAAGIIAQIPDTVYAGFESWATRPEKGRTAGLRAEFTRLFYTMPRLVSLNGADWVQAGLSDFALKHGERAAVGLEYRKLNLKNRKGSNEPFDNVVSELDFLSYITSFEADAFEAGDALNAREWERVRTEFIEHHFDELARGVSQGIRNSSENAYLLFCAALLDIVVSYS